MGRTVCAAVMSLGALLAFPFSAAAAIVDYDGGLGHLTNPTNQTSFEAFTSTITPANQPYIEDGLVVEFVSASEYGVVRTDLPNTGDRGWAAIGQGEYTRIRLTNGSLMDEIQWKAAGCCGAVIYYGVYREGALVEPVNHFGAIGGPYRNFGLQGTNGMLFDEIRLVVTGGTPFAPNQSQGLQMDDLSVHALNPPSTAPVPEPGVWTMMILGVGGIGAAMRRVREETFKTTGSVPGGN